MILLALLLGAAPQIETRTPAAMPT